MAKGKKKQQPAQNELRRKVKNLAEHQKTNGRKTRDGNVASRSGGILITGVRG